MNIGVPKEIKNREYRVGLTPASVRELTSCGHNVFVEKEAGFAIGYDDAMYEGAGARIAASPAEVYAQELVIKVKEPQPSEIAMLRKGQLLFTYLHLAPDPAQTRGLLDSGCIGIAYETVTDPFGGLPLLAPMSEVAGRLSIQAGAHCLELAQGGMGTLLGGVPGVAPGKVVIIGGGVVGENAAKMATGLGADVTVIDKSVRRLKYLDELFGGRIKTLYSNTDTIESEVLKAHLVIGAVLLPGASAPKLVTADMVKSMRRGAVLVDVAIDQGGCFETSHPTTHEEPTYTVDDVVHYCVANMPGAVARTSTQALNNATLPFALRLANEGVAALKNDAHFLGGLNVHTGKVTHAAVASAQGLEFTEPLSLL
ncbi:MAG: alanine dehydrogenase [Deltaproteobacteria bacterium]|nr:MAG: alanine dehydrogenase [Deltaproteobacteria bacterium]